MLIMNKKYLRNKNEFKKIINENINENIKSLDLNRIKMNFFIKYQNFHVDIYWSTPFLVPDTNRIFFRFFVRSVSGYHKKFRETNSRFLKHKVLVHRSKNSIL
jgi:hypothetical protein